MNRQYKSHPITVNTSCGVYGILKERAEEKGTTPSEEALKIIMAGVAKKHIPLDTSFQHQMQLCRELEEIIKTLGDKCERKKHFKKY